MPLNPKIKAIKVAMALLSLGLACSAPLAAQAVPPSAFAELRWRLVGPFRGGRTLSAVGVPGSPSVFYSGAVGGGVWKSTDSGTTWQPVFDGPAGGNRQPIASIGAIAVAPSNPSVVYAGSGEADMRSDITYGNGIYKSTDAGKTWAHIGLEDSRQIGRIVVDPHNPDIVLVAALGHAYGPNRQRGVFRTTDGGRNWNQVLYKDDDTGAIDLALDPRDAKIVYASLWQTRRPPWNVYPPSNGPGSGLYKSTDGGVTWRPLSGNGLPSEGLGHIGIAVAPSDARRIYLVVDAKEGGLYRSDDAGASWIRADSEKRIWGRGWYFGGITVDPKDADVVFVSNTSVYKSTDGGHTFTAFKGAPGGDDYHSVWISPEDSMRIAISSDQGSIVSLNGGQTWSSWYNQPTGQFYHVSVDHRFPYWLYGAQQDSGAMTVPSRSNFAAPSERDWHPVGVGGESGMIVPDPGDPNIVFGGTVSRYDLASGQEQDVSPAIDAGGLSGNASFKNTPFRSTWTSPLAFSGADRRKLYFGHQSLFRTINGGKSWDEISPDLTRENPAVPSTLDPITARSGLASPRKGVIYSIAPSPLDPNLIWVGTDDGLIHRTTDDGRHWQNVTPAALTPWSKVGAIEASRFDKNTAYAAIDRHRLEDLHAYIYRTRDGGRHWQPASQGIPDGAYVNVVREDRERAGLLYAGAELGMFVSFNDGDAWQPLQLNLPVASVRDIAATGDDLVIATHGRAFWILDDVTPLRQLRQGRNWLSESAHLFQPQTAIRVRPGSEQGTPYPPETPHGENPPPGAIIDYYLPGLALSNASAPPARQVESPQVVTLEIIDSSGTVARRFASDDHVPPVDEKTLDIPMYWIHPAKALSAEPGMHRFVWDLHYASGLSGNRRPGRREVVGPWAVPGRYTVRLSANGQRYEQPLLLKIDPRLMSREASGKAAGEAAVCGQRSPGAPSPCPNLQKQFAAARRALSASAEIATALAQEARLTKQLDGLQSKAKGNAVITAALQKFKERVVLIAGRPSEGFGSATQALDLDRTSLRHLQTAFSEIESAIESADAAPTPERLSALANDIRTLQTTMASWHEMLSGELPRLNAQLRDAGFEELSAASTSP